MKEQEKKTFFGTVTLLILMNFAILANSFCKESDYEYDSEMVE